MTDHDPVAPPQPPLSLPAPLVAPVQLRWAIAKAPAGAQTAAGPLPQDAVVVQIECATGAFVLFFDVPSARKFAADVEKECGQVIQVASGSLAQQLVEHMQTHNGRSRR